MRFPPVLALLALSVCPQWLAAQSVWTGAIDSSWNNDQNWSTGTVPGAADDVVVPAAVVTPLATYTQNPACRDLTIDSGATMTLAAGFDLGVGGNLTVAGSLTLSGADLVTVVGDWTNDGTFTNGGGQVTLSGTGVLAGSTRTTFQTLLVQAGTRSAQTGFTVDDSLTIAAGATLDLAAATVATVSGNWTSSAPGATTTGAGSVELVGTGNLSTGANSIPSLAITGGMRTALDTTVAGSFLLQAGALGIADGSTMTVGGSATLVGGVLSFDPSLANPELLDIQGSATFLGTDAGPFDADAEIRCAGDWIVNSPFIPGAGVVRLDGNSSAVVTGSAKPRFADLVIFNGTKTLQTGIDVSGNLTVSNGATLIANGSTDVNGSVSLGNATTSWDMGGLTHSVGASYTSLDGSATNGKLVFDGAGGTLSTGLGSVDEVQIDAGPYDVAGANVLGDYTMTAGATTVASASVLAIGGDATLNGGTLSLLPNSRMDVEGDADFTGVLSGTTAPDARIGFGGDWTSSASWIPLDGLVAHIGGSPSRIFGQPFFASLLNESGNLISSVPITIFRDLFLEDDLDTSDAVSVGRDVSLSATADWTLGGALCSVGRDWTSAGGSASAGAVSFDGGGELSTGSGSIENARFTAGVRTVQDSIVTTALVLNGGTLRIEEDQTLVVQGDATLNAGALGWAPGTSGGSEVLQVEGNVVCTVSVDTEGPNSEFRCRGSWVSDSTFAPTAATVVLDGVAPGVLLAPQLHHLVVVNGGRALIGPLALSGDLTLQALGVLDADDVLDVEGSVSIEAMATFDSGTSQHTVAGDWISSGNFVGDPAGVIEFDGTGVLETGSGTIGNVLISSAVRSIRTSTVAGNLTMTDGVLDVQDGQTLTLAADLVLDGGVLSFGDTVDSGGSVETIDVGGSVDIDAFAGPTSSGARILVAGDWTGTGKWNPPAGTVVFDRGAPHTIGGTFPFFPSIDVVDGDLTIGAPTVANGDLTLREGQTLTVNLIIMTILGDVLLEPTSTWNIAAQTKIAGDWTSTGATVNGTGTLEYNAAGTLTTGASQLPNVNISNGARQVMTSSVAGNLLLSGGFTTIADDQTLTVDGNVEMIGGELSFEGGAPDAETLRVQGDMIADAPAGTMSSGARIEVSGNWTSTASWTPSDGVVALRPAGSATIEGEPVLASLAIESGSVDFLVDGTLAGGLTVLSGASLALQGALDIGGDVVLGDSSANVDLGGATHSVAGDWISGGCEASNGSLVFDGDGVLRTGVTTLPPATITAGVRIAENSTVGGDLIQTGGTLRIAEGETLLVQGNANLTAGTLEWAGVAPGGDGVLEVEGNVTCTLQAGNTTPASRFLCRGDWTSSGVFAMANGTIELNGFGTLTGLEPGLDPAFPVLEIVNGTRSFANDVTVSYNQVVVEPTGRLEVSGVIVEFLTNSVAVQGTLAIGPASKLALGPGVFLTVVGTGTLEMLGLVDTPAVLGGASGGGYGVNVGGTLSAQHFRFEEPGPGGIGVTESATLAPLVSGVFAEPSDAAGSFLLDIRRTTPTEIRHVDFESSVGGSNVRVLSGAAITFAESAGNLAGDAFEIDPLGIVDWIADPTLATQFSATGAPDRVDLAWTSTAEGSDLSFWAIERATDPAGPFTELTLVAPTGPATYAFPDLGVVPFQKYFYRLVERRAFGEEILQGEDDATPWTAGLPPQVLTVGPASTFPDIQSAINSAFPGAVVLVEPGTYPAFTINGGFGTLRVYGDGTGPVFIDTTAAPVTIQNIGLAASVELSDLEIGDPLSPRLGLQVLSCTGVVVLDELVVHGGVDLPGVLLNASTRTAIQRCDIDGTPGAALLSGSSAVFGRGTLDEIELSGSSNARLAQVLPAPTATVEAGSSLTTLPGIHADVDAPELVQLGVGFSLTLDGEPGGPYGLVYSASLAWFELPPALWEMVGLVNLAQAPLLTTGAIGSPTVLNLPLPPDGVLFGATLPLQMVVVNPVTAKFRWSNVTSITLGN